MSNTNDPNNIIKNGELTTSDEFSNEELAHDDYKRTDDYEYFCATQCCLLHVKYQPGKNWARIGNLIFDRYSANEGDDPLCGSCHRGVVLSLETLDEPGS